MNNTSKILVSLVSFKSWYDTQFYNVEFLKIKINFVVSAAEYITMNNEAVKTNTGFLIILLNTKLSTVSRKIIYRLKTCKIKRKQW